MDVFRRVGGFLLKSTGPLFLILGLVIFIWLYFSAKPSLKEPPYKLKTETWTAAIQQFDTLTHKEVVFYGYVTETDFETSSVSLMDHSTVTTKDFLTIDNAVNPWDEDITLKTGLHLKIELLYIGKSKSNAKMDSLKNIKEHGEPLNFN